MASVSPRLQRPFCALLAVAVTVGCGAKTALDEPNPFEPTLDAGFDAGLDAGPPDAGPPDATVTPEDAGCVDVRQRRIEPKVDVLFVIDNSGSMSEEQATLVEAFGTMAAALATGDIDGDGVADFPSATDLHVGVVTTDLGAFNATDEGDGLSPRSCGGAGPLRGDDGRMRRGCGLSEPFVDFQDGDSVSRFAEQFGCLASVGIVGCGFEMPLEAALKALTPSTSPIRFAGETLGRLDTDNAGFLREDSVLALIILTDEDDGSVGNNRFTEAVTEEQAVMGTAWLHGVERYVSGFEALRDDPDRIVLGIITGLPGDLANRPEGLDAEAALADPRMQRVYNTALQPPLEPSCTGGQGRATPPRRLVELAGRFGERAVVRSICEDNYRSALAVVTERVGEAIVETVCVR